MLTFPDQTMVALKGLDEIMAELFEEKKEATHDTVQEILTRLEEKKNYIPSSERALREYVYALQREYRNYVKARSER